MPHIKTYIPEDLAHRIRIGTSTTTDAFDLVKYIAESMVCKECGLTENVIDKLCKYCEETGNEYRSPKDF